MKIIHIRLNSNIKRRDMVLGIRRVFVRFGVYIILLSIAVLIALLPYVMTSKTHESTRRSRYAMDLKYILLWKRTKKDRIKHILRKEDIYPSGQKAFITQNCPYINCYLTYNKSLLPYEQNFDAIVFNINDLKKIKVYDINLGRYSHQKFIFKSFLPSQKHPVCNPWLDGFFNWTWTYKLDSDIPHPFINIYDLQNKWIGPAKNVKWVEQMKNTDVRTSKIKRKTKAVAWFVTSCNLKKKHMDFVQDLKTELLSFNQTLDIFGPCTENKMCGYDTNKEGCLKKIENDYHFQLVLEDAVTEDYVTERLAKVMSRDIVPIVLGRNFSSFIPPGSYINAGTFHIKKLGAVVNYLSQNPKEYSYFLDWKNYYHFESKPRHSVCDLCAKMNEKSKIKSYTKFRHWWNKDYEGLCENQYLRHKFNNE